MRASLPVRVLTGIFLGAALAATPVLAQEHQHAVLQTDVNHTPAGEPLHKKAAIEFAGTPEEAAFYRAAWTADLAGVRAAVAKNPAIIHSQNDRVMGVAAEGDSLAVLRFLAGNGGNLAAGDNAPLMRAVGNGNIPMFDYIVSRLPAIPQDLKDLLMVTSCYLENPGMVRRVHALGGVNLDSPSRNGDSPSSAAAKHGTIEILTYVVDELHADFHAGDEDSLRQAVSHNRPDSVRFLLARGANPHAAHDEALRMAVAGGDFDKHGGSIGYPEAVAALLEYHADPHAIGPELMKATERKYPKIADMLKASMREGAYRAAPPAYIHMNF